MTAYHGGKQILGKKIAHIIDEVAREIGFEPRGYLEPFVGMCGVYKFIPSLLGNNVIYVAGDINGSVVQMWSALQEGWKPPRNCTKKKYQKIRETRDETPDSALKGYVGHQYSYGGIYFGSYRGDYVPYLDCSRARERVQRIAAQCNSVNFYAGDYRQFSNVKGYIIYCDPPYSSGANKYVVDFDFEQFVIWARKMAEHNLVFISNIEPICGAQELYSRRLKHGMERLFLMGGSAPQTPRP